MRLLEKVMLAGEPSMKSVQQAGGEEDSEKSRRIWLYALSFSGLDEVEVPPNGEDKDFDYGAVDHNDDYDDTAELDRDEEDIYFEADWA